MEEIITLIPTLGFPAACVVVCGWYINKMQRENREDSLKREERMHEQHDKLSETISNATTTIDRMNIRLDVIENKIDDIKQGIR